MSLSRIVWGGFVRVIMCNNLLDCYKQQRHLPIGYRSQNGRAEMILEEAELIQRIFQDYQEGATIYGIAKWMTELGVLNANGHPSWNHGSIGNLLKNIGG